MQSPQGNVRHSTKTIESSKRITSEMDSNATRSLLVRKKPPFTPWLPQHVAAAVTIGLALSFAAVVESAAVHASPTAEAGQAEMSLQDRVGTSFNYFPRDYKNQATEIEPLPAQF